MQFTELRYQDPATKTYLGSPSIVRLANGDLLATHDYFGPGCPLNHESEEHLHQRLPLQRRRRDVDERHARRRRVLELTLHAGRRRLPDRRVAAVRLHRHPPQHRQRQHVVASGGRGVGPALQRRPATDATQLPLRADARCGSRVVASTAPSRTTRPATGLSASRRASSPPPSTQTCWTQPTGR